MIIDDVEKSISKIDSKTKINRDNPDEFRVFIYTRKEVKKIISGIDKMKKVEITKISDYPFRGKQYPICVLRVKVLRFRRKKRKTKTPAK